MGGFSDHVIRGLKGGWIMKVELAPYTVAGSASVSIFLMPVLAVSTSTRSDGSDTNSHRMPQSLQRSTTLTANAHRMEQSNATRMMTKLEPKLSFATLLISVEPSGLSIEGKMGEDGCNIFRYLNNLIDRRCEGRTPIVSNVEVG
jgi:hypothetical protein